MPIKCNISFRDNPHGTFYAGQEVQGVVELELEKPKAVQGVAVTLRGGAKVTWQESSFLGDKKEFNGSEEYITKQKYIAGPFEGDAERQLAPGIHTFDFSFELTDNLPTSFEGSHGYIRYTLQVLLERPWKYDLKYKKTFTVLKQLDLNYDSPDLRLPLRLDTVKQFQIWPCRTAPLNISVTVPISGFVSGQMIPVSVVADNNLAHDIRGLVFSLKMIITYHAEHPESRVRREKCVVVGKESGGVPAHEKRWFQHHIAIPAVPPSNAGYSKAIEIAYLLEVKVIAPKYYRDFKVKLPLTIGTVPLAAENIFSLNVLSRLPEHENARARTESMPPAYSEVVPVSTIENVQEPPTFEESLNVQTRLQLTPEEHEDVLDGSNYLPRYPVYHFDISKIIQASKSALNESTATIETTDL